MKSLFAPAFFVAIVVMYASTSLASNKPGKALTPLSADEVAIYNAILQHNSANDSAS
jgi:hypothetical protein